MKGDCDIFSHSFLLVNELGLNEGKLDANGVKNINFLNEVIAHQYYNIDFVYSQVKTEISCPVVSFSNDKSILGFDLKVPYKGEVETDKIDAEIDMDLSGWLSFLLYCKDIGEKFVLGEQISKKIVEDFVEEKKKEVFGSWEQFKYLMSLSKYLSIFNGDQEITYESFQSAKEILIEIEVRRK